MRTRIAPNTDTFYAVHLLLIIEKLKGLTPKKIVLETGNFSKFFVL